MTIAVVWEVIPQIKQTKNKICHQLQLCTLYISFMLGNFSCFSCRLLTFLKLTFFPKKVFQEHYQSVKQSGSRSVFTCVLGAQKNSLIEMVLLSTQNMFGV